MKGIPNLGSWNDCGNKGLPHFARKDGEGNEVSESSGGRPKLCVKVGTVGWSVKGPNARCCGAIFDTVFLTDFSEGGQEGRDNRGHCATLIQLRGVGQACSFAPRSTFAMLLPPIAMHNSFGHLDRPRERRDKTCAAMRRSRPSTSPQGRWLLPRLGPLPHRPRRFAPSSPRRANPMAAWRCRSRTLLCYRSLTAFRIGAPLSELYTVALPSCKC